ncbi:hypothetical protein M9H77_23090 [Catharanthus roseus]|uniref:Uncharacterized protein n=1 Tax=Catharanthus roseus TaxID=4058 RepID=A0ACC0AUV7_CATRO|nr:hypothetical protein M9H77_23090 [Catharanthus roseus]
MSKKRESGQRIHTLLTCNHRKRASGLVEEYFLLHHRSGGSPNNDPALVALLSGFTPLQNNKGKANMSIQVVHMETTRAHGQSSADSGMSSSDGCHWRLPDLGKFKLNINAAWNVDSSGIGSLIRDHQRQVQLSFTMKLVHLTSPEHAETVAIREGLRLVERFGYSGSILESDCKGVFDQLRTRSGSLGLLGHIYEHIFSLVDKLNVSLCFVRLYANVSAHTLVVMAISTYYSNVWMEMVPLCIAYTVHLI